MAYVANLFGQTVSVLNTSSNTVVATIPVGYGPFDVAVHPNGSKVYVSNDGDSIINIIDAVSNTAIGSINIGSSSLCLTISPDGTKLYVAKYTDNEIDVINTSNNSIIASIPVGAVPYGISLTPDGTRLLVTNSGDNTVSIINTITNTVINTIPVGNTPQGIGKFISTFPTINTTLSETPANNFEAFVYPNPSDGEFNLKFPEENIEYFITNILGQEVIRSNSNLKTTAKIQLVEKGMYILHMLTSKGLRIEKIVIK
ncbi:MAG: T9SS type A sorting domain-containing protein [Bacteroidota bacterium]|nr:MAG: T9SS type A sorting domain-containing protein [Bacteroidota bacterium]